MSVTPGELSKIKSAVADAAADLLARTGNDNITAEELADQLADAVVETVLDTYEEIQAKSYNLVVLGHFTPDGEDSYIAAVGPLSTRAPQRARGIGERFAWDYKTRRGTGKFMLVPLIRNPNEAWDEARQDDLEEFSRHLSSVTPGVEPTYEAMRFDLNTATRRRITADWQADPDILVRKYAPACLCGLPEHPRYNSLGQPATPGCPRHPEGRNDD